VPVTKFSTHPPIAAHVLYLRCMTEQEIIAYFETADLPQTLRLDRASHQHDVAEAVARNIKIMQTDDKNGNAKHRLLRIIYALQNPFTGQEIPKM
jgi:hypothetical protein